jgi:hypothetical protein
MTAEEFKEFIVEVEQVVKQKYAASGVTHYKITWSWDNCHAHGQVKRGDFRNVGVSLKNVTHLPPWSGDMHSVIEQAHANICGELKRFATDRAPQEGDTLWLYIDQLQSLFQGRLTAQIVRDSLKHCLSVTLPAIIERQGGYPPKQLR